MAPRGSTGDLTLCCFPVSDRLGDEWNDEDYDIRVRPGAGDDKHSDISDYYRSIHTACFPSSPGVGLRSLICMSALC